MEDALESVASSCSAAQALTDTPTASAHAIVIVDRRIPAPIDPAAWKIVDGRLFLNYDRSIQRRWERDIPGFIAKADANWPALAAK